MTKIIIHEIEYGKRSQSHHKYDKHTQQLRNSILNLKPLSVDHNGNMAKSFPYASTLSDF